MLFDRDVMKLKTKTLIIRSNFRRILPISPIDAIDIGILLLCMYMTPPTIAVQSMML